MIFVMDALFYFEPVQRFEYRGDMLSFRVQVTARRAREFAVTGDVIFVFAVSLGKVSGDSLI